MWAKLSVVHNIFYSAFYSSQYWKARFKSSDTIISQVWKPVSDLFFATKNICTRDV